MARIELRTVGESQTPHSCADRAGADERNADAASADIADFLNQPADPLAVEESGACCEDVGADLNDQILGGLYDFLST